MMDTMMRQLLSKDVLHEPMKEIGERYPEWLAANKGRLSEEDFGRYAKQHQHIKELCVIYENTPDDFQKIVELMQKMQDCGQPPSDIIRELAPGLELGDDGLPMYVQRMAVESWTATQPSCRLSKLCQSSASSVKA